MKPQDLVMRAQKALDSVQKHPGKFDLDAEELGFLKGLAKGYPSLVAQGATMLEDIERAHLLNGAGPYVPVPGGSGRRSRDAMSGIKVHHGAHGEVFELAPQAKLASVIKSDEKPPVSMDRWLAAALLGGECKDAEAVEYAHDTKSVSSGTSGVLIPVAYQGEWLDAMRANMVLSACGITTVTMNNPTVTGSRQLTDPTAAWRAEGGALTASDPTFELQNLVAKSLYVRTKATAELAADSPDWGSQLMTAMTRALAVEVDRAGLMGSGSSNQPRGLDNVAGINVQAKGADPVPDAFMKAWGKCLTANCRLEDVEKNLVTSIEDWLGMITLRTADGQYIDGTINAMKRTTYRPTPVVPQGRGFVGDFKDLVLGVRQEASVEALKLQSYGDNLMLEFIGTTRVDFLCRRPTSFTKVTGL